MPRFNQLRDLFRRVCFNVICVLIAFTPIYILFGFVSGFEPLGEFVRMVVAISIGATFLEVMGTFFEELTELKAEVERLKLLTKA